MYRITRKLRFSYAHRLMEYEGKCARLHGHEAVVRVTVAATALDRAGMVTDFFDLKRSAGTWIEEVLDHRTILRRDDPAVGALRSIGEEPYVVDWNPTVENLSRHIFQQLVAIGVPVAEISIDETESCSGSYRPDGDGLSH